jgi:hypothetical protein
MIYYAKFIKKNFIEKFNLSRNYEISLLFKRQDKCKRGNVSPYISIGSKIEKTAIIYLHFRFYKRTAIP